MVEKEKRSMTEVRRVMEKEREVCVKERTSSAIRWSGLSISFLASRM